MTVKVRLYGTLGRSYPSYVHSTGLEVEIADGATLKDLLSHLGILTSNVLAVSSGGQPLKADAPIRNGDCLSIFQPLAGG